MVDGAYSLTNHGVYNISGAALGTAIGSVNIKAAAHISGSHIVLIPMSDGKQVNLLQIDVASA